ncbi:MAG: hypothetical protein AAFW98_08270, partial [Pseudomonadota bacterium]
LRAGGSERGEPHHDRSENAKIGKAQHAPPLGVPLKRWVASAAVAEAFVLWSLAATGAPCQPTAYNR